MSTHDEDTCPHFVVLSRLEAENARLKAEVERLKELFRKTERLMLLDGEYEATKVGTYARLQAQVERLTKAADEVDAAWSVYENGLIETPEWVKRSQVRDAVSRLWNAAKDGKTK